MNVAIPGLKGPNLPVQGGAVHARVGSPSHAQEPTAWILQAFVALLGIAMFLIAVSGFPNLLDNERRVGGYVLDAVQNGHWMIQRDTAGVVASKPPLLTWIAALVTLGFGELNLFAIYFPSALATVGVALVLLGAGKRYFGWQAGFLAALMYLVSFASDKQLMTARYDGLLALPVILAALAAFRAWSLNRGWTWFWLAAAVGTLAKGPIALVLGAAGLFAHLWEKRTSHNSQLRGSHWLGVLVYLTICGGWFLLAYSEMGQPLTEKMLGRELAAHATGAGRGEAMFLGFYEPPLEFLSAFAPWSLLAFLGFWRVARQPALESETRRFERFLFCSFFFGLVLFCIAAHQRGRLIFPLIPFAALLAGREGAQWLRLWAPARLMKAAGVVAVFTLGILALYHHVLLGNSERIKKTLGCREVAAEVRRTLGKEFPLVLVDVPFALQFYLGTARPVTSLERAADLLQGDFPAVVAISDLDSLLARFPTNSPPLHELARWPSNGIPFIRIVSNHPVTETDSAERLATILGPLRLQLENLEFVRTRGHEIVLRPGARTGTVSVVNESESAQQVRIRILARTEEPDTISGKFLAAGERWSVSQ